MQIPSRIRFELKTSRPRMMIIPTPFLRPTISAASTAIHAAKKLSRSIVNTCGSTAGKDHPQPDLLRRGAVRARGLDQPRIDRVHRRHRRQRQQEVDAGEDDEDGGLLADAEQHDARAGSRRSARSAPGRARSAAAPPRRCATSRPAIPVATAATKPSASPASTRHALARIAIGIGIASRPKPTRKSLSTAKPMNCEGGGKRAVEIQPRAAPSSHSETSTTQGASVAAASQRRRRMRAPALAAPAAAGASRAGIGGGRLADLPGFHPR